VCTIHLSTESLTISASINSSLVYTYIYIYMYTCIFIYIYTYIYVYIYIYIHTHKYINIYCRTRTFIQAHKHTHRSIYTRLSLYISIYTYTYIHTYIQVRDLSAQSLTISARISISLASNFINMMRIKRVLLLPYQPINQFTSRRLVWQRNIKPFYHSSARSFIEFLRPVLILLERLDAYLSL